MTVRQSAASRSTPDGTPGTTLPPRLRDSAYHAQVSRAGLSTNQSHYDEPLISRAARIGLTLLLIAACALAWLRVMEALKP